MEEKFKSLCNKLILENEEALKIAREKVRISSKENTLPAIIIFVSFFMFVMSAIWIEESNNDLGYFLALLSVGTFIITLKKFLSVKKEQPYNELYQEKIIKPLMQLFYNEAYVYMPNVGFPRIDFEKIELRSFDTYNSTNLILGKTNKSIDFKAANVNATKRIYSTFTNQDTIRSYDKEIFKGIVMELECQKTFNDFIYLKGKDNISLKPISEILKKYELDKENVEDFEIYTSSEKVVQNMSLYEIMQKFLICKKELMQNSVCELIIRKNHIFLMFPNAKIPGTNVILYDNQETMYQELWAEFKKIDYLFNLANEIINMLIVI